MRHMQTDRTLGLDRGLKRLNILLILVIACPPTMKRLATFLFFKMIFTVRQAWRTTDGLLLFTVYTGGRCSHMYKN